MTKGCVYFASWGTSTPGTILASTNCIWLRQNSFSSTLASWGKIKYTIYMDGSGLDRTDDFQKFADQDWIGFNFVGSGLDSDWKISQGRRIARASIRQQCSVKWVNVVLYFSFYDAKYWGQYDILTTMIWVTARTSLGTTAIAYSDENRQFGTWNLFFNNLNEKSTQGCATTLSEASWLNTLSICCTVLRFGVPFTFQL